MKTNSVRLVIAAVLPLPKKWYFSGSPLYEDRQTIDAEDTDVVDGAYLVGIQQFYRACAGIEIVLEGDAVVELHDGAVGLPDGEVNGVGLVEYRLRGGDVLTVLHLVSDGGQS